MRPSTGARYRTVQGLSRGLALLHAINRSPGGWASIAELSGRTGLHRTTVRRMLETLQDEGYVRRSDSDDSYRLTHKIRQLSDGFTDDEWISEIANPVLGELLGQKKATAILDKNLVILSLSVVDVTDEAIEMVNTALAEKPVVAP